MSNQSNQVMQGVLRTVPLFQGLVQEDLELLSGMFTRKTYSADSVIFSQGDRAVRLYILLSGEVAIQFKPHDGDLLDVTTISEGGVFGWSSALGRDIYSSYAISCEETSVLSIRGDKLRQLCSSNPNTGVMILERLAAIIAERLRSTHKHVVAMLWDGINTDNGS
jgi:CRP/FNR family transcriptional regulator, cyclic AMP receptor protein